MFEQSIKLLQVSWSGRKGAKIVKTKMERKIKDISIFLIFFVSLVLWMLDEAECMYGKVKKVSLVFSSCFVLFENIYR